MRLPFREPAAKAVLLALAESHVKALSDGSKLLSDTGAKLAQFNPVPAAASIGAAITGVLLPPPVEVASRLSNIAPFPASEIPTDIQAYAKNVLGEGPGPLGLPNIINAIKAGWEHLQPMPVTTTVTVTENERETEVVQIMIYTSGIVGEDDHPPETFAAYTTEATIEPTKTSTLTATTVAMTPMCGVGPSHQPDAFTLMAPPCASTKSVSYKFCCPTVTSYFTPTPTPFSPGPLKYYYCPSVKAHPNLTLQCPIPTCGLPTATSTSTSISSFTEIPSLVTYTTIARHSLQTITAIPVIITKSVLDISYVPKTKTVTSTYTPPCRDYPSCILENGDFCIPKTTWLPIHLPFPSPASIPSSNLLHEACPTICPPNTCTTTTTTKNKHKNTPQPGTITLTHIIPRTSTTTTTTLTHIVLARPGVYEDLCIFDSERKEYKEATLEEKVKEKGGYVGYYGDVVQRKVVRPVVSVFGVLGELIGKGWRKVMGGGIEKEGY